MVCLPGRQTAIPLTIHRTLAILEWTRGEVAVLNATCHILQICYWLWLAIFIPSYKVTYRDTHSNITIQELLEVFEHYENKLDSNAIMETGPCATQIDLAIEKNQNRDSMDIGVPNSCIDIINRQLKEWSISSLQCNGYGMPSEFLLNVWEVILI